MPQANSSKSKIYKLLVGEFKGMWMTLARHILRKRQVMNQLTEGVNREHTFLAELPLYFSV